MQSTCTFFIVIAKNLDGQIKHVARDFFFCRFLTEYMCELLSQFSCISRTLNIILWVSSGQLDFVCILNFIRWLVTFFLESLNVYLEGTVLYNEFGVRNVFFFLTNNVRDVYFEKPSKNTKYKSHAQISMMGRMWYQSIIQDIVVLLWIFYFIFSMKCDSSKVDNGLDFQNNHPFVLLLLLLCLYQIDDEISQFLFFTVKLNFS